MELIYQGVALSNERFSLLKELGKQHNIDYRYLITQLWVETQWGTHPQAVSARVDNNWGGMTWTGNPNRPSGVVVTQGLARPSAEGGYYMHYSTVENFLVDWAYLLRPDGSYKVSGAQTVENYTKGLFRTGGAKYDYAASGHEHYLNLMRKHFYAIFSREGEVMTVNAEQVLKVARDHIGATKYGSIHKALVDRYNQERPLPLGYTLKYDDDWCDAFVTTVSILANATHLIGQECGCERHIEIFKQKGIWIEDGSVTPQAGWIIVWNWDDVTQLNDGFADHIGFVESVKNGIINTIEDNTFIGGVSQVGRNQFKVGDGRIRGYAKPKYGAASSAPIANPAPSAEQEVKKHIICTISELRVFNKPSGTATIVDTITSSQVKNIDKVFRDEQYLWGSYISYAGDRRYTTLETSDGTRKFVDIKEGFIDHATYKVEEDTVKVSDTQKVGGQRSVELKSNEFELGGVVYVVTKK